MSDLLTHRFTNLDIFRTEIKTTQFDFIRYTKLQFVSLHRIDRIEENFTKRYLFGTF